MNFCTNCGAQLGFGRFCTNCGQPIPAPEQTAPDDVDQTQVRLPRVQPDASNGPRFPLYAPPPQTPQTPPTAEPTPPQVPVTAAPAAAPTATPPGQPYPSAPPPSRDDREKRRSPWPWVALALVLLLGAGGGVWALTRGGDDDRQDAGASEPTGQASPSGQDPDPSERPSESTTPEIPDPPEGDPVDVAAEAEVSAPKPTKPRPAAGGNQVVSYPATNMLDDDPTTAYRIDGDATGATITFSFDEPVLIEEVGLINGYAKVDGGNDWYVSNRKVLRVEWSFDDGTTAEQELRRTTDLQAMQVAGTMTETVTLRLLQVSEPGKNPRDTTAISTVLLRGVR